MNTEAIHTLEGLAAAGYTCSPTGAGGRPLPCVACFSQTVRRMFFASDVHKRGHMAVCLSDGCAHEVASFFTAAPSASV